MADSNQKVLESMPSSPISPELLTSANWWFNVSWYGLLVFGMLAALASVATVICLFLQFWSAGVKERQSDWRTEVVEQQSQQATADVEKAKADVATANQKIAAANEEIARSSERAAALEKDAAQARLEQRRIEAAVAWRVVAPDNRNSLVNSLANGSGGSVEISYPSNDSEALFLASQFNRIFSEANAKAGKELWSLSVQPRLFARVIFWDLSISGQADPVVRSVREAFSAAGLPYQKYSIPNQLVDGPGMAIGGVPPSDVMVWIGSKRPPN